MANENINNSNNNRDGRSTEFYFWKVFKNVVLLKLIFRHIHSTEWIKYNNPEQYNVNNRSLFKNTHSLDLMVKNSLYSLIKNKIDNNDYIKITKESIENLFRSFSSSSSTTSSITAKEIIELFLSSPNKRIEFEICDLTRAAVYSIESLRILINEPYSIIVYPSTLEFAIGNCSTTIVTELLKSNNHGINLVTNEIKKKSLKLASENQINSLEMLKLILDNPNLYSKPPFSPTAHQLLEQSFKRFKSDPSIKEDEEIHSGYQLIEFKQFIILNCSETMNKLMELEVISRDFNFNLKWALNLNSSFELLLTLLKVYYKYYCNYSIQVINEKLSKFTTQSDQEKEQKIKELQKSISIEIDPIDFYYQYKLKYNQEDEINANFNNILIRRLKTELFLKSIKLNDTKSLESIDNDGSNFKLCHTDNLVFELPSSINEIYNIIDYFNASGYKAFDKFCLFQFYNIVTEVLKPSSFKVNLLPFIKDVYLCLTLSLTRLNFKMAEMYTLNIKTFPFSQEEIETCRHYLEMDKILFNVDLKINFQIRATIEQIKSTIMVIINTYSNEVITNPNIATPTTLEFYQIILNYLFEMLIKIKGISVEQVIEVYKLLAIEHSIKIKHGLYHSFFYLQIRSSKFIKYLQLRPGLDELMNEVHFYNCEQDYGQITYGFDLKRYLKTDVLTFDYLFGLKEGDGSDDSGEFINSFDDILAELMNQLSVEICFNNSDSDASNGITRDGNFFTKAMNSDLEFCLNIKRIDLFWKQLDFIYQHIENKSNHQEFIFNSPKFALFPTSKLFRDKNHPIIPTTSPINIIRYREEEEDIEDEEELHKTINSFKYSKNVLKLVCIVFDVESIQKFISYNFYVSHFQDIIYSYAIYYSRFDVVSFLLENYKIKLFKFPWFSTSKDYCQYLEIEMMLNNHLELVKSYSQTELDSYRNQVFPIVFLKYLVDYLCKDRLNIIGYQEFLDLESRDQLLDSLIPLIHSRLFKNKNDNVQIKNKEEEGIDEDSDEINNGNTNFNQLLTEKEKIENVNIILQQVEVQQLIRSKIINFLDQSNKEIIERINTIDNYNSNINNLFNESFIAGDIKQCNLILNYFQNQFKITTSTIKKTISNNNIHIIKYYYNPNNCKFLINNFQKDNQLSSFLKQQLVNHIDYKFNLDWFGFN